MWREGRGAQHITLRNMFPAGKGTNSRKQEGRQARKISGTPGKGLVMTTRDSRMAKDRILDGVSRPPSTSSGRQRTWWGRKSSSAPTPPVQGWTAASLMLPCEKQQRAESLQSPLDEGLEEWRRSNTPAQNPRTTLKNITDEMWQETVQKYNYLTYAHILVLHLVKCL